jgi:hypothetical protein
MRFGVPSLFAALALAACGGSSAPIGPIAPLQVDGGSSGEPAGLDGGSDPGNTTTDGSPPPLPPTDAGAADADPGIDGTPQRLSCTATFGTALSINHGRLDGRLVAIVPTNRHACNSDSTHLHLQVAVSGSTYDVAVNLDALTQELDASLPDGAWSEGWHETMSLDYVSGLGLHSSSFTMSTPDVIQQRLIAALTNVNHISIFATGYGPGGAHLVHRQGGGRDGAVFLEPLSPKAHAFVFHFDTQTF